MIHNIAFRENWDRIQKIKQDIINKSNQKENKSQIPYEYKVGDQVLSGIPGGFPEIVNTSYRTISCNECAQEWYNQNPKSKK
jgi:hypothetical protein